MSAPLSFPPGTLIPPLKHPTLGEKVVNAVVLALAAGALLCVAWLLRFMVLPLVFALLATYVLGPVVDRLENRGLSRMTAVMLCGGVIVLALVALGFGVWPSLESWLQEKPQSGEQSAFQLQLEKRLGEWQGALTSRYPNVDWGKAFGKLTHVLDDQQRSLVEGLPAMALGVLSHAGSVGLAVIIAFFVLLDGAAMKRAVLRRVPNRHFEYAMLMLDRVDRQISSYLIGTAVENLLVAVLMSLALWALGMPNALVFGILFGVANVIPFAGPFIGAAAGMLFSLLDPSAPSLGVLAVAYFVVHMVDAMLINPMVMGKSLDMHPLTVIVGIFVGGTLGGVLGMLAIIPLIAVVRAIVVTVAEGVRNAARA